MLRLLLLSTVLSFSSACCSCCDSCAPGESATASEDDPGTGVEWSGINSGIHEARRSVVRSAEEWSALWLQHAGARLPSEPVPVIDWTRQMVVVVVGGDRPTAGYGIEITGIAQEDGKLVVRTRQYAPASGSAQAQVVTSPFVFRTVSRFGGEVLFRDE